MYRLTLYEFQKIWRKRSFLFSVGIFFLINLFLLWYTNFGNGRKPELSDYKEFQSDIQGMSESEKKEYLESRMEMLEGVLFVRDILIMQNSEMGNIFAEEKLKENPGMFEKYYEMYQTSAYLRYTDSLDLEYALIDELYEEECKAADYEEYLQSVQESKAMLSQISIFSSQDTENFSSRNIQKSAEDYEKLNADGIRWMPSKAIVSTLESIWTDLLLILISFLFVGGLITEEKQKGLFHIIRSTKYGMAHSITAKYLALLLHSLLIECLFYGSNYLFFGFSAGWCDVTADLQSLAPYMESSLPISIGSFLILSVFTKAILMFGVCAVLTAFCILSETILLPYIAGLIFWIGSWALYRFIPPASKTAVLKHINLFGILKTERLYGSYLNLNIGGYPVSRLSLSWIITGVIILTGISFGFLFFVRGKGMQMKDGFRRFSFPFRPHASLFRHESYKILIVCHGFIILLFFTALLGYRNLTRKYTPSEQEQYYQSLMLELEGELTEEKVRRINAESERFQEAFEALEAIDEAVSSGSLDQQTGEAMKLKWYAVTAFYPTFRRVEEQYAFVSENGGEFIYDTGYLYWFGILGNRVTFDFLLLTVGIILAFCQALPMEYRNGSWRLIYASEKGKRKIIRCKVFVCGLLSAVFSVLPLIFRYVSVSKVFPIHRLFSSVQTIPAFREIPPFVTAAALIGLKIFLQIITGICLMLAVFLLSAWRKEYVQTILFSFLILCVPIVLSVLGFRFAEWFSLYPVYSYGFT